ncbi:compound eye opsin BCRH1-like isoform X2 [Artemia franciscana]|uniref:compound eye opsin BCRH1-like isoform X2 n=1 Tax=Artemia franciscana TaxID=6661 RepID=UPI0032D9D9AE
MIVSGNTTWPVPLKWYSNSEQAPLLGYPEGTSARDLAPIEVRHLVLPHFDKFPPADPRVHYLIGLLYLIFGFMSSFGNYYVLKIFAKYKQLRSPSNLLVINLAFCDFMLFAGLYPELIFNCFFGNGVWMFGEVACIIHAWFGTVFGFGQMLTLSVIAYDRFYVITKGMTGSPPSYKRSSLLLIYVWTVSLFWGSSPLFGLGRFTLDGILSSCSYDYISREMNVYIYIAGAWFNGFVVPITQIIYCYFFIVRAVFIHEKQLKVQAKKMNVKSLRSSQDNDQGMSAELRVAKCLKVELGWICGATGGDKKANDDATSAATTSQCSI